MSLHEIITSTKELLKNLIVRSAELSQLYTSLSLEVANERLSYITEDLSLLIDVIPMLNQQYPDINVEELQEKLNLILEALETKDYSLVADLLLFELKPLLESWEELLINE